MPKEELHLHEIFLIYDSVTMIFFLLFVNKNNSFLSKKELTNSNLYILLLKHKVNFQIFNGMKISEREFKY